MKNTEDNSWEDHWRETLAGHQSTPTTEDWSGMKHLLETQATEPAEALAGPNVPRLPESNIGRFLNSWPQSLLALLLVGSLGFGLGQCRADDILDKMNFFSKEAGIPVDFSKEADTLIYDHRLTPQRGRDDTGRKYSVRPYLALDENGKPTGRLEYDTTFLDNGQEEEISHSNLSEHNTTIYRFDTIYELDDLGNLSDKIYSIDTTIRVGL